MWNVLPAATRAVPTMPDLNTLYPLNFQIGSLFLTALCLIPCAAFLRPARAIAAPRGPGVKRPLLKLLTGKSVFADLRAERDLRIAAFIGALLMAYVVGLGFYLLPLRVIFWSTSWSGLWNALQWPVRSVATFGLGLALPTMLVAFLAACWRIEKLPANATVFDPVLGGARNYSVQPTWASGAFFGTVTGLALVAVFLWGIWRRSPAGALFCFVRSANLGNRVSPLMPLIFLGTANLCLIGGDLWRLRLLEDCRVALPFLGFAAADSFNGVAPLEQHVIEALECPPWRLSGWWLMVLLLAVGFSYFASSKGGWVRPIDGRTFDFLFFASSAFIYLYFSTLLLRFAEVWRALHRLLRRLYWHPSRSAYEALRVGSLPGRPEDQRIRLIEPQPTLTAAEFCLSRAHEILAVLGAYPAAGRLTAPLATAVAWSETCLGAALTAAAGADRAEMLRQRVRTSRVMAVLSGEIVRLVEPAWRLRDQQSHPPLNEDEQKVMEAARLFVASRVVDLLRQVFPQLANLAGVAMTGVLAMMLALSVYPFVQRDTMVWLSWVVLLSAIAVSLTVFVQANRSRIVSMLMGTTPGRFSWDSSFSIQLLIYGLLPILTLFGAQ